MPCGQTLSEPGSNSDAPRTLGSGKNQWPSARVRARSVSNLPAPAPGGRARTGRSNQVRWVSLTVRRAGRDVGRYVVVRVYVPDYGVGGHTGVSDEL